MKTFLTLSLHLLITSFLFAQAPQGIPYQAVMRNADGSVMASSEINLKRPMDRGEFSFYEFDDKSADYKGQVIVSSCEGKTSLLYDEQTYNLVEIGSQCWFADNLSTDQYRNGDFIPTGLNDAAWGSTNKGAFAIYNNDLVNEIAYGKLYNWFTIVDPRGICPKGWHVPSENEWTILESHLGGEFIAGGKMKAKMGWVTPNIGATNDSGFTGLPGGMRSAKGNYYSLGYNGMWWTSTENTSSYSWWRILFYYNSSFENFNFDNDKHSGFSIRCLKDN